MNKMNFVIGANTDVGNIKKVNQDSFLCKVACVNDSEFGLFVVCDGVGGLSHGEVASNLVINKFREWFNDELSQLISKVNYDERILKKSIEETLKSANKELIDLSLKRGIRTGTTATILFIINCKYYIVHVGDSRVYIVDKTMNQLTEDQTYYAKLMRDGEFEKAKGVKKSILLQCIGVKEAIDVYFNEGTIEKDTVFLVCSDGFYNKVDESKVVIALKHKNKKQAYFQKQCEKLIQSVKNTGERDNITLININVRIKKKNVLQKIKDSLLGGR